MEINQKLIILLNNRQSDLKVELGFLKQLKNVNQKEVPSAAKTIQQLTKKLQKRLKTKETTIEGLETALGAAEFKMKAFLGMDRNTATLSDLGANKSTVDGLNKLRNNIEKEVLAIYNITDADFVEENTGETNE